MTCPQFPIPLSESAFRPTVLRFDVKLLRRRLGSVDVRSAPVIRECFTGESFANELFEQAANPTWNLFQRHRFLLKASQTLSRDRTTHIKRVLARSTPDKCNIGVVGARTSIRTSGHPD